MKKFLKVVYFAVIIAVAVFVYNYFTGYSLFDFDVINAPVYQEEIDLNKDESSQGFKKLYYSQLDEEKRKIYDKIYFAVKEHKETVRIYQSIDSDDLFDIVNYVLAENPELFWSNGACTVNNRGKLTFDYMYTAEEAELYKKQIEENTKDIIAQANAVSDEYERALLLFDFVAQNTTYDNNAAENLADNPQASTIAGPFIYQSAVCGGYARAYQYLLNQCSLNAETVFGTAAASQVTQEHAWTLQYLDGNYYYTDVTWGDSFENTDSNGFVSHTYFCLTEQEISSTHTLEKNVKYPECSAVKDNYFVRENLYFTSYSKSEIRKAIKAQIENGNNFIELKFENSSDYSDAVNDLITNGNIYYLLLEIDPFGKNIENDSLSYSTDDDKNVLTLILNMKN